MRFREHSGIRYRGFEASVTEMREEEYDDWPLEGPRTTKWLCLSMGRSAPSPVARHHRWLRDAEIPNGDRSRHEHHILSWMLETAVCYDCLQVSNLAAFEILARRLQHIEQAHVENPLAPCYGGAEHYLGSPERRGGALLAPGLALHVAGRLRDEAAIEKERRKAQEMRSLPRGEPKGGDSKGGKGGHGGKQGKKGDGKGGAAGEAGKTAP